MKLFFHSNLGRYFDVDLRDVLVYFIMADMDNLDTSQRAKGVVLYHLL